MNAASQNELITTLLAEVAQLRQEISQLKAQQSSVAPAAPTKSPNMHRRRLLKGLFMGAVATGAATIAVGSNLPTASAALNIPNPIYKIGMVAIPPGGTVSAAGGPTNANIGLVATSSSSVNLSAMPSKVTAIYATSYSGSFGAYGVYAEATGGAAGFPSAGVYSNLNGYGDAIYAQGIGTFTTGLRALSSSYDGIVTDGGRYGIIASGDLAPLRLVPGASSTAPVASGHSAGEFYVTSAGALYFFNGTAWKLITS